MRQFSLTTALAAGALALSSMAPASAITVTSVIQNLSYVPTGTDAPRTPDFGVGTVDFPTGNSSGLWRSPWETPAFAPIEPMFSNNQYTSVRNGSAGYNIGGNILDIFWGSPDTYNSITFYTALNGGGDSFTFGGAALLFPTYGRGHDQVRLITDVNFFSIRISSTTPAFEFANLNTCGIEVDCGPPPNATPLPAALPLFASALSFGGFLGWRKRRRTKAAAVAVPA